MDRHFTITFHNNILSFPGLSSIAVGQSLGCDVRLPNLTQYEDVVFAKIAPDKNSQGWHIVKTSPYFPITINGTPLNRVCYLKEGDVIDIQGNHLKFNVREGAQGSPSITHIHKSGKVLWTILTLICATFAFVVYSIYDNQKDRITDGMRAQITESIFTTRIDSLHLVFCDSVVDSYIYAAGPIGTAFLTADSLIVTARHCLQPWLNKVLPHDYALIPTLSDWSVQKALMAETENQLTGKENWRLVSFVTLTDEKGASWSLSSDQFRINTERDDIVELGDFYEPKYWRSISHRYNRRDMMLGDIAVARADKAGNIALADKEDLIRLLKDRGVRLTFVGHPESSVNGSLLDFKSDELRLPLQEAAQWPGHIFMLAHEGGLTPGFSGGPVIVRAGIGFKAVGVVSVVDERNGNRSYSVPASEIELISK